MNTDKLAIGELINRRRRQILVHSIIYYRYNNSLISDAQWSKWAMELDELQKAYPDIASKQPYDDEFKNFDPSSGYDLPLNDAWGVSVARLLLKK